jgi:hypothetical protein
MKKFVLIALVTLALSFAAAPKSEAGVAVGVNVGFPIGYCGYPYPYYPYPYYPAVYPSPFYGSFFFGRGFGFGPRVVVVRHPRVVVVRHHPPRLFRKARFNPAQSPLARQTVGNVRRIANPAAELQQ